MAEPSATKLFSPSEPSSISVLLNPSPEPFSSLGVDCRIFKSYRSLTFFQRQTHSKYISPDPPDQQSVLLDPSETETYGERRDRTTDSRLLPPGTGCSYFWDQRHQVRADSWNVAVFVFLEVLKQMVPADEDRGPPTRPPPDGSF